MRKKRYILGGAGLLLGIAFSGAVTIAYLTRSVGEVRNVITAGSVKSQADRGTLGCREGVEGVSRSDPGEGSCCAEYRKE